VKRSGGERENFEFLILNFELSNRRREEEEGVGEEGKRGRGNGEEGKWVNGVKKRHGIVAVTF
jgi:hypothetical protein